MEKVKEKNFKPNAKQQECIDNIQGKYLVLAGPGTGKTFTIVERIKAMILSGINPEKILCLTFTEAAANEMKNRINKGLGTVNSHININTYHGFCYEIIEEFQEEFELPSNINIISESIRRAFIKNCIDEFKPKYLRTSRNDPYYFIDIIKYRIDDIKRYRLSKEEFFDNLNNNPDWKPQLENLKAELAEKIQKGVTRTATLEDKISSLEDKINKIQEIWDIYELYNQKTEENRFIDFNDMISLVLNKFDNSPSFLQEIASRYEYLMVDEYQDTNRSQNEIIFNLASNIPNIFVVGDDDQIIYTFQGAKLDTMENFLENFPDSKVICLEENMRSTQEILDVARIITKQDDNRLEVNPKFKLYNISKDLTAKNEKLFDKNKKVRCYAYVDEFQEMNEITKEIEELIESEDCPTDEAGNKKFSEIAIFAKSNKELDEWANKLKSKNIPCELKDGRSVFEINSFLIMFYYMKALINPELYSSDLFKSFLTQPFKIHPTDFKTIYDEISKNKCFIDTLKNMDFSKLIEPEKIRNFIETFDYLQEYRTNESLRNTILEIGSKTGIFQYFFNSEINRAENVAGLKKLLDEAISLTQIQKVCGFEDFVNYLQIALNEGIEIKTDKSPVPQNAVQLVTYHSSKGREFEYVYMPTLVEKKWEKDTQSRKPQIPVALSEYKTDEEIKELKTSDIIKLLYVGITRAKHTLRLSFLQTRNGKNVSPTEFLNHIDEHLEREEVPFKYDDITFIKTIEESLSKEDFDDEREFKNYIKSLVKDKTFSPTEINTYLNCPRQYLYSNILSLVGREGSADAAVFGSAIHAACENCFNYAKENNKYPTKEQFIAWFEKDLARRPLSTYENRQNLIVRGQKALAEYYVQFVSTPIEFLYNAEEKLLFELDGIKFKGIIDRIEKMPDGSFIIMDYKTGGAKTKGKISPTGDHWDYYNQIALYKYFFEKNYDVKVKETTFIFPEEPTKNLTLTLTNEECEEVVEQFKEAVCKIKECNFEPTPSENACKYCNFKAFCNMLE